MKKRRKGLCIACDEPYFKGHQCKSPHLFMMIPTEEDAELGEGEEKLVESGKEAEVAEEAHITLHALSGHAVNNTIRVIGMVKGKPLSILIDSGSTNNFLDTQVAQKLKFSLEDVKPVAVTVADGFKVYNHKRCKDFKWEMQGHEYETEMKILPLGGIDAVLGVQWLKHISPL